MEVEMKRKREGITTLWQKESLGISAIHMGPFDLMTRNRKESAIISKTPQTGIQAQLNSAIEERSRMFMVIDVCRF